MTLHPSPRRLALIASLGSAALLAGAFGFQHLGGLAPCELCIWQRWPHAAAIALGAAALALGARAWLCAAGALSMAAGAAIAFYHTGVERGWWQGPQTCSGGPDGALNTDELLRQIMAAPVVRCNEVAWEFLGLSMASWNGLASAGLALLWGWAALRAYGSSGASQYR
ncbi:disulfide bond formation protein B [Oceanicella actignis]|uniref:disulfide bond formation protein B n=1 Tax=Oceanicella actignis TaxID=1189325 RepID=UPI0011E7CC74|nr:disulfide bond formation protein B [Oceanicella actignis]TYO90807.1 disulfide bond formation protein DsbB [Oceanicella actignis]